MFIALLSLLVLLCSCHSKSDPWTVEHVQGDRAAFSSSRLVYRSKDKVNGIDLELVRTEEHTRLYLIVHAQHVPPYQGDPKAALVILSAGSERIEAVAMRHEGGQRLLVPEELGEKIMKYLEEKQPLTIRLQGYSVLIDPSQFPSYLKEWKQPPLMRNPLKLPF